MKKILLIDDSKDLLDVLTAILEAEHYQVQVIADPDFTLDIILDYQPDLIVLDVILAEIDGRELCNQLKNDEQTKHIPIIMCSGMQDLPFVQKKCKAEDFLRKPFTVEELLLKVQRLVN